MNDKHRGAFTQLEHDGIPRETALENLLRTQKVSSSFKRACRKARETHWVCPRPRKTPTERQANKMRHKPIVRVLRAFKRAVRKLNKIESRIPSTSDERTLEYKRALMAPLIARAVAARSEVGQRARSIQLYTAYKLIRAAEKQPDKFNVDEVNAAKKFLLESLVPPTTPATPSA